jgi:hypothetical protein
MPTAKFTVGDTVRFIGTDQHLIVNQCRSKSDQFQVQREKDEATREWVPGIYLELVKPARPSKAS